MIKVRVVMKNARGFTLVEIMIVVAVIVLLASLAIPNVLRARLNANEAAAISTVRLLSSCMENFRAAHTPPFYATSLQQLANDTPPYIDSKVATGLKNGYSFTIVGTNGGNTYLVRAEPEQPEASGVRTFTVSASGIIYADGVGIE